MTVQVTTPGELVQLRAAGRLAWQILQQVAADVRVGVRTAELATRAEALILAAGATATSKGFTFGSEPPFPAAASISINDQVMYAVPTERALVDGDVITIDLTLRIDTGWHADVATSITVGRGERAGRLVYAANTATSAIVQAIRPGAWWSEVFKHAEEEVGALGLHLLRGPVGHGIGRAMHEKPSLFYGHPEMPDTRLRAGMVIAVEPVVLERASAIVTGPDRWTTLTDTGAWAAFEERMVVVTVEGAEVLTL